MSKADESDPHNQEQGTPLGSGHQKSEQGRVKGGKPPKTAPPSDYDPFILEKVFPDLTSLLAVHPGTDQIASECVFVLDANSLLAPFAVSQNSLKDLAAVYRRLSGEGKLFTAARALREYAKHRSDRIKNVYDKLIQMGKHSQQLERLKLPLLEGRKAFQELHEARERANETLRTYDEKRQLLADEVRNWNWNDDVSKLYAEVFTVEKVLDHDIPPDKLLEDVKWRSTHRIPPGFQDHNKPDMGIGDVHIWHTMLKAGAKTNVIFVSDDEKNDWMVRVNREALFARSELIAEFFTKTKHHFAAVNFRRFLQMVGASAETVSEVKRASVQPESPESLLHQLATLMEKLKQAGLPFGLSHTGGASAYDPEDYEQEPPDEGDYGPDEPEHEPPDEGDYEPDEPEHEPPDEADYGPDEPEHEPPDEGDYEPDEPEHEPPDESEYEPEEPEDEP